MIVLELDRASEVQDIPDFLTMPLYQKREIDRLYEVKLSSWMTNQLIGDGKMSYPGDPPGYEKKQKSKEEPDFRLTVFKFEE